MKSKLARRIGMWLFGGVVSCGLAYSIAVLTARPAYAATCTPQECSLWESEVTEWCDNFYGGLKTFLCPYPLDPSEYYFVCNDGNYGTGLCDGE
jgi:hypothetical protein